MPGRLRLECVADFTGIGIYTLAELDRYAQGVEVKIYDPSATLTEEAAA